MQLSKLKEFVLNNQTDKTVSVQQQLNETYTIHLTILSHTNTMYFAVYSELTHTMLEDINITDSDFMECLQILEKRMQYALYKNPPRVNKELAELWVAYLQTKPKFKVCIIE